MVEVWFGIIERQAIHRGTFGSVKDLNAKIRAFIEGWNNRCDPFVWTKTADEILKKANRSTTTDTRHQGPLGLVLAGVVVLEHSGARVRFELMRQTTTLFARRHIARRVYRLSR